MKDPKAFIQTMIALASASLGLVAALAWNEAIKALIAQLHLGDSLGALFGVAIITTIFAIVMLAWLASISGKIGGTAAFEREAEG